MKSHDSYQRHKNFCVSAIKDYLNKEVFELDRYFDNNDYFYTIFFENVYDYFYKNNLSSAYIDIMRKYIDYIVSKNDLINLDVLIENIEIIKNYEGVDSKKFVLSKKINKIQKICKKTLHVIN